MQLFKPTRNYWRMAHASRASFLVDAAAFFKAFADAAAQAQKQIFIIGWDTDSRTELPCPNGIKIEGCEPGGTITLAQLLTELANQRPELKVYVLSWDFAFIYLFERESLPSLRFSTLNNERVRFILDQEHPALASHHQKIVVIDDQIAFSGGLDLTQRRWDTPEHRGHDPRRVDPAGHCYGPFHDVQLCTEGEVAAALGDVARERWRLATGEVIAPPSAPPNGAPGREVNPRSPWPSQTECHMRDMQIAVSRTLPYGYCQGEDGEMSKPVVEVERLFLDMIRMAKKFCYIENQYFTSPMIARSIAKRLREEDGPEFVMVLPRDQTGWIEESTMGLLRSRALRTVLAADKHGRFKCYHPVVPGLDGGYVKVHSKVMIVDDQIVRVGSANLNNRSMGLDTECDLTIDARERLDLQAAITRLRNELMGEHLDVRAETIAARFAETGSLVKTAESLRGSPRTLVELHPHVPEWVGKIAPPKEWIDPAAPHGIRRWWAKRIHQHRHFLAGLLTISVVAVLFFLQHLEATGRLPLWLTTIPRPEEATRDAWRFIRSWDAEKIAAAVTEFRGQPWAIPAILIGFVIGTLIFVPITAMIFGVALSFPQIPAVLIGISGAVLAALVLYGIGRYWAFSKSKTLAHPLVKTLSEKMKKGGVWAMTAVRLTPIAPFAAVGIVAGGLRIRLRDYVLGTIMGLLPGVVTITLISQGAAGFAQQSNWFGILWLLLALAFFAVLLPRLVRRFRRIA